VGDVKATLVPELLKLTFYMFLKKIIFFYILKLKIKFKIKNIIFIYFYIKNNLKITFTTFSKGALVTTPLWRYNYCVFKFMK